MGGERLGEVECIIGETWTNKKKYITTSGAIANYKTEREKRREVEEWVEVDDVKQ